MHDDLMAGEMCGNGVYKSNFSIFSKIVKFVRIIIK